MQISRDRIPIRTASCLSGKRDPARGKSRTRRWVKMPTRRSVRSPDLSFSSQPPTSRTRAPNWVIAEFISTTRSLEPSFHSLAPPLERTSVRESAEGVLLRGSRHQILPVRTRPANPSSTSTSIAERANDVANLVHMLPRSWDASRRMMAMSCRQTSSGRSCRIRGSMRSCAREKGSGQPQLADRTRRGRARSRRFTKSPSYKLQTQQNS